MSQWTSLPEPRSPSPSVAHAARDDNEQRASQRHTNLHWVRATPTPAAVAAPATARAGKRKVAEEHNPTTSPAKRARGLDPAPPDAGARYSSILSHMHASGSRSDSASKNALPELESPSQASSLKAGSGARKSDNFAQIAPSASSHSAPSRLDPSLHELPSPAARRNTIGATVQEVIIVSDDEQDSAPQLRSAQTVARRATIAGVQATRETVTHRANDGALIDLTLDSDDESEAGPQLPLTSAPLSARQPSPHNGNVQQERTAGLPSPPRLAPEAEAAQVEIAQPPVKPSSSKESNASQTVVVDDGSPQTKHLNKPKDYYLKFWTEPRKIRDKQDNLRWELQCRLCPSIRTIPRREGCETLDDEIPRPKAVGNLRSHIAQEHPNAEADFAKLLKSAPDVAPNVTPANAPDVVTIATQEKDARGDTNRPPAPVRSGKRGRFRNDSYFLYWSDARAIIDGKGSARWEFRCKLCPSRRTVPRSEGRASFDDERPRPREFYSIMTHTIDAHDDAEERLEQMRVEKAKANEGLLKLWHPPTTDDQSALWWFRCKLCPVLCAAKRSNGCQAFDDEELADLESLGTHVQTFHKDLHGELARVASASGDITTSSAASPSKAPASIAQSPVKLQPGEFMVDRYLPFYTSPFKLVNEEGNLRWKFCCKFCTAIRTIARSPEADTFQAETPYPPKISYSLVQHIRETHGDLEKSLIASTQNRADAPTVVTTPSSEPLGDILRFWCTPWKTVNTHGAPRWVFQCKYCTIIRTVPRSDGCESWDDEQLRPGSLNNLSTHTRDEHPQQLKALDGAASSSMQARTKNVRDDQVATSSAYASTRTSASVRTRGDTDRNDEPDPQAQSNYRAMSSSPSSPGSLSADNDDDMDNAPFTFPATPVDVSFAAASFAQEPAIPTPSILVHALPPLPPLDVEPSSKSCTPSPPVTVQPLTPPDSGDESEPAFALSRDELRTIVEGPDRDAALAEAARKIRWPAEEFDTLFYEVINKMPEWCRRDPELREVFLRVIENNTLDEPSAAAITMSNPVNDDPCPPWEFYYTNRMVYGHKVARGDKSKLKGCDCVSGCASDSATCACLQRQRRYFRLQGRHFDSYGFNYNAQGRIIDYRFPVFECNEECGCDETCLNKVTQRGRQYPIEIMNTPMKGWGVFAKSDIPAHSFVGIYAGELITDMESHLRGDFYDLFGRNYMFTIDMWYLKKGARRRYRKMFSSGSLAEAVDVEQDNDDDLPSFCVDAFHVGNFTRFLNHCCDPNCVVVSVHVNEPDISKPFLAIFSSRRIPAGDELTFSYLGPLDEQGGASHNTQSKGRGRKKQQAGSDGQGCFCGAQNCVGYFF